MKCSCWICWGDAYRKGIYGDWDDLICLACGHYKISRRLLKDYLGRKFDVERMRDAFFLVHAQGCTPIVDRYSAIFVEKTLTRQPVEGLIGWPTRMDKLKVQRVE
jgi:hypothetical protein